MGIKKELPKEPVTFRLDAGLKPILDSLAVKKGLTISKLINLSVCYFLEQNGIETDLNKKGIAEIILLLEAQRFNFIGYEKYVDELKIFVKELNISDENLFEVFKEVLKNVWQLSENQNS